MRFVPNTLREAYSPESLHGRSPNDTANSIPYSSIALTSSLAAWVPLCSTDLATSSKNGGPIEEGMEWCRRLSTNLTEIVCGIRPQDTDKATTTDVSR